MCGVYRPRSYKNLQNAVQTMLLRTEGNDLATQFKFLFKYQEESREELTIAKKKGWFRKIVTVFSVFLLYRTRLLTEGSDNAWPKKCNTTATDNTLTILGLTAVDHDKLDFWNEILFLHHDSDSPLMSRNPRNGKNGKSGKNFLEGPFGNLL